MLKIKDLHVSADGKEILKGIDLEIQPGELHAIMGPNGAGKSTLAQVLAGHEKYAISSGSIELEGKNLMDMAIEERAREGLFLGFQYPVEIPGVTITNFLKAAINAKRTHQRLEPMPPAEFLKLLKEKAELVGMTTELKRRPVNVGFSGGEKKRAEIFQLAVLDPKFAVLDETDSGLDIDALKSVSEGINKVRSNENGFLLITHYQRLLNYVEPDFVHVLMDGKIVKSGGKELALELESKGYDWLK